MSKLQLIGAINSLNASASPDWLARFDVPALRCYLDHLQLMLEPRGRRSVWVRSGETAAVVTREPAD